jgi:hypothetical protein
MDSSCSKIFLPFQTLRTPQCNRPSLLGTYGVVRCSHAPTLKKHLKEFMKNIIKYIFLSKTHKKFMKNTF